MPYELQMNDEDWRSLDENDEKLFLSALDKAFLNTSTNREDFDVSEWELSKEGKSIPVEYLSKTRNGAAVSVDFEHEENGPDSPHVGWQSSGKRKNNAKRGHILLRYVPAGRKKNKN